MDYGGSNGKGEAGELKVHFGTESVGLADVEPGGKEEVGQGGWRGKLV